MTTLIDPYHRRLSYLRLSITDLCNYRCSYCLPNGYQGKAKPDELTLPEIQTIAAAFAQSLRQPEFADCFERIVFAIYDRSPGKAVCKAFTAQFQAA